MDSFEEKMFLVFAVITVLVIGGALYFAGVEREYEGIWAAKCEQAGGVPSKYFRLCIKKENVVEVVE